MNHSDTFIGFGAGAGLLFVRKRGDYIDEERTEIDTIVKLGFPVEIRFGALDKYMSYTPFYLAVFFNINTENTFYGFMLNFNFAVD